MRILGIETSCDETAVAIIDVAGGGKALRMRVVSNIIASQVKLHAKFGGVVPNLARREHEKNLVPVLLAALRKAKLLLHRTRFGNTYDRNYIRGRGFGQLVEILGREPELYARAVKRVAPLQAPKIDAIAVTVGPGLAPALWVGVNFARALGYLWGTPIIPVNHLEGHILTNLLAYQRIADSVKRIGRASSIRYSLYAIRFPALCLIVSGGHTELVLMSGYGRYRVLGETRDDAAGEAFDKVAKMLDLGFPGGPAISRLAERGDPSAIPLPRPMIRSNDYDFSFSGLKTAALYALPEKLRNREIKKLPYRCSNKFFSFSIFDFCASFEQAVVDVLVTKTIRAAKEFRVKTVMIGGGVAANSRLRVQLGAALSRSYPSASYLVPSPSLTGDNALMVALAGYFNRVRKSAEWADLGAVADLRLDQLI